MRIILNKEVNKKDSSMRKKEALENKKGLSWKGVLLIAGFILALKGAEVIYFSGEDGEDNLFLMNKTITESLNESGFVLKDAFVKGNENTSLKEVIKSSGLKQGESLFTVNIDFAVNNLKELPWVENVVIKRIFPDTIRIDLYEHTPLALWQNKGKYYPISTKGVLLSDKAKSPSLASLPIVTGKGAHTKLPELLEKLDADKDLRSRIKALVFVGERRWDVILDDVEKGITISLPEKAEEEAWARLIRMEEKYKILKRKLTLIDLRLPDKLIVRLENSQKLDLKKSKGNGKKKKRLHIKGQEA